MASTAKYADYPTPPPSSSPQYKDNSYKSRPAQETYFEQPTTTVYSRPASPNHWATQPGNPNTEIVVTQQQAQYEYLPSRRSDSPRQSQIHHQQRPSASQNPTYHGSSNDYYTRPASPLVQKTRPQTQTYTPPRRRSYSPPKGRHSPRPLYYSPTNPIPSPYNVSRPTPRPGFIQRMLAKIENWLRAGMKWCKRNPITAGLLTFIPVLAGAGLVRAVRSLGIGDLLKRMGAGQLKKGEAKKEWEWGMDHFVGFAGSKGGPLEGMLKILQMGINHYCRLTSSSVPRLASIILELYFLEIKK